MECIKKPFDESDGKGYYEIFPEGHIAAGKIRARYLVEPSPVYLDELARQPKIKTPEELQAEQKAKWLLAKTVDEKLDLLAERQGLI